RFEPDRLVPSVRGVRKTRGIGEGQLLVSEREVDDGPTQRGIRVARTRGARRDHDKRKHWNGEQRIEYGHDVPCDARARERPKKLRAVARAGVEQAMAAVTEQAERVRLGKRQTVTHRPMKDHRADQCADRYERERVREMTVKLEEQQRVGAR